MSFSSFIHRIFFSPLFFFPSPSLFKKKNSKISLLTFMSNGLSEIRSTTSGS